MQDRVLGYVLRQQLVRDVRNEYEQISNDIQSPELVQNLPLPLANEAITWPHAGVLCFPKFGSEESPESCSGCHGDRPPTKDDDVLSSWSLSVAEGEVETSTPSHSESPLAAGRDGCWSHATDSSQCDVQSPRHAETSLEHFIKPALPKDRQALLQLKSQLTMELLWVKQAIASRQEVRSDTLLHACTRTS